MKKALSLAAAGAALVLAAGLATSAGAVTYTTTYTVTDNQGNSLENINNGLVVQNQADLGSPFTFSMTGNTSTFKIGANNMTSVDLFDIWTNEQTVDSDDTNSPRGITVHFAFTAPGNQVGDVSGDTYAVNGTVNNGVVHWTTDPIQLNFGGETLTITLDDATFNAQHDTNGFFGIGGCSNCLDEGILQNADVVAHFTQTMAAVPEPASWALMIGGFGMTGAMMRRRRTATAAAA